MCNEVSQDEHKLQNVIYDERRTRQQEVALWENNPHRAVEIWPGLSWILWRELCFYNFMSVAPLLLQKSTDHCSYGKYYGKYVKLLSLSYAVNCAIDLIRNIITECCYSGCARYSTDFYSPHDGFIHRFVFIASIKQTVSCSRILFSVVVSMRTSVSQKDECRWLAWPVRLMMWVQYSECLCAHCSCDRDIRAMLLLLASLIISLNAQTPRCHTSLVSHL